MQRLMRDFKRLQQDPPQGVNGSPNADNIMLWNAVIFGPEETPWDGGKRSTPLLKFLECVCFLAPLGHVMVYQIQRDVLLRIRTNFRG